MISATFDPKIWASVPPGFWSVVIFIFGTMVGSFLNVCIYRMPLGLSVVTPPSHCPHCKYSIPWFLNVPLLTWLTLRGKCRNCGAPISVRYFLVELLTGVLFLVSWLLFRRFSVWVALIYCLLLAGLIAATFIDFEHFIIPDEITIGGMAAGFLCSLLVPALHDTTSVMASVKTSLIGMAVGAGSIYAILLAGKLMFGRQRLTLPADTRVVFTETSVHLPDKEVPYEDLFYRKSDVISVHARHVELADRCYKDAIVRLSPNRLTIGDDEFDPENVPHLEAVTAEIVLPREAMGFGDVKFMGAIGAFLGWQAVVFSLLVSSVLGSIVGVTLIIMRRREWSSRIPYGPYIALASIIWLFCGWRLIGWWLLRMNPQS
jgi:leader peptidase (prepilin peptidase)/N-methyltransferase